MPNPFLLASILSVPDLILLGLFILLLLGPRAGRTLGSLGRTILDLKRQVDDTKEGIKREVHREIGSLLQAPPPKGPKPPELPRP